MDHLNFPQNGREENGENLDNSHTTSAVNVPVISDAINDVNINN